MTDTPPDLAAQMAAFAERHRHEPPPLLLGLGQLQAMAAMVSTADELVAGIATQVGDGRPFSAVQVVPLPDGTADDIADLLEDAADELAGLHEDAEPQDRHHRWRENLIARLRSTAHVLQGSPPPATEPDPEAGPPLGTVATCRRCGHEVRRVSTPLGPAWHGVGEPDSRAGSCPGLPHQVA